jgi:hypothetical protein
MWDTFFIEFATNGSTRAGHFDEFLVCIEPSSLVRAVGVADFQEVAA